MHRILISTKPEDLGTTNIIEVQGDGRFVENRVISEPDQLVETAVSFAYTVDRPMELIGMFELIAQVAFLMGVKYGQQNPQVSQVSQQTLMEGEITADMVREATEGRR